MFCSVGGFYDKEISSSHRSRLFSIRVDSDGSVGFTPSLSAMDKRKRPQSRWLKRPDFPGPLLDILVIGFLLLVIVARCNA